MKHRAEHLAMKLIITIIALLLFAYVAVASVVYDGAFLPGSTISGEDVSGKTVEQVEEMLQKNLSSYNLTIQDKDGNTQVITGEDIDLKYDFNGEVRSLMNQHGAMEWIYTLTGTRFNNELPDIAVSYDESKLAKMLGKAAFLDKKNMEAPVNASIDYSDEKGFTYVQSAEGSTLDLDKVQELVKQAILTGESSLDLKAGGCYLVPEITEDDPSIKAVTDVLNPLTDFTISYKIGEAVETIDRPVLYSWYRKDENGDVYLKESCVEEFVKALAEKYDTVGAKREFVTNKGKTITVQDGPYGWKINQKEETAKLLKLVKEAKTVENLEPTYSKKGFGERGKTDIGDTYIEISIEDQHMWYYENGKLWMDTDVVTGKGGKHTQRGVAFIHNKARNATLVGPGYRSFVKYWMKVWNGVGIHDASWRSKYGGTYYLTDGSHGCINTPLDNVIKLYNRVEVGTPVVIY